MTNPEIVMCKLLGKHKLKKVSKFKLVCSNCGCEFVDEKELQILLSEINCLKKENDNLKSRLVELERAQKIIDSYPKDPLADLGRYKEVQRGLERFRADYDQVKELYKLKKVIKIEKKPQYYEDFWY